MAGGHRFRAAPTAPNLIHRTSAHRTARAALIARYQPGDPCCLCGHPMLTARYLEADHDPHDPTRRTYRGLAHGARHPCQVCGKRCNSSDGARRGGQHRTGRRQVRVIPRPQRRDLLG